MVSQRRTRCVPRKKKTRWFSLYLCFLLQIFREFHFSLCFVLFLSVAIRFYIHIYIYICMYVCSADYLYDAPLVKINHHRILDLWQLHEFVFFFFFKPTSIPFQVIRARIFEARQPNYYEPYSRLLAHFVDICSDLLMSTKSIMAKKNLEISLM